nr:pentapeptide repeat-containing protein [Nakamurella flavida]
MELTDLAADCSRCAGLCCVVPAFARSADFAIDKPAGTPCPNLQPDTRCGIHTRLRDRGFAGCTVYDCFGAGQQLTQVGFGGRSWQGSPALARDMFATFPVARDLHELLWFVVAARDVTTGALRRRLQDSVDALSAHRAAPPEVLRRLDVDALHASTNVLLRAASDQARSASPGPRADHRGADLFGADLRPADLRGASLRGALMIGADLRRVDLALADLTGADLRGADLRGADLRTALFVQQAQLESARGDDSTALPPRLTQPAHWATRRRGPRA